MMPRTNTVNASWACLMSLLVLYAPPVLADKHPFTNKPDWMIEPDWMLSHVNDEHLVIVDVREPDAFSLSHVPSAVNIPVSATFATGNRADLVAPISTIRDLLGRAGISQSSLVVIYDDGDFINAARVFWVMEVFGMNRVAVLNLGFEQWKRSGYPVTTVVNKPKPVRFFPAINPDRFATTLQVRLAIDNPDHILIDARSVEEYQGLRSETSVFGHISGAVNVPTSLNLDASALKIRPLPELARLYDQYDKDTPVTVYCNKGKQSSLIYFVLRNLGYKVSAYDGSWLEWSQMPENPVQPPSVSDD